MNTISERRHHHHTIMLSIYRTFRLTCRLSKRKACKFARMYK